MDGASITSSLTNIISSTKTTTNKTTSSSGKSSGSETTNAASNTIKDEYVRSSKDGNLNLKYPSYADQCKWIYTKFSKAFNDKLLPYSVFNSFECEQPEVQSIVDNIDNVVSNYISGSASADDIKTSINQAYNDILAYNVSMGRTDGTTEADNAHILECVYQKFVTAANMQCQKANSDEGNAIAAENGLKPTAPYVYYNSKYYYAFSEIKQAVIDATQNLAAELDLSDFSASTADSKISPTQNDFNEYWSANATNNKKISAMLDTSAAPPKDFILYFSQSTAYADEVFTDGDISKIDDGSLTVTSGGQSSTYTVPFDYYSDSIKELFSASDIISESDRLYTDYLKNFILHRYYLYG